MVAQCCGFAYAKLAILETAKRSRRVPKWNREREKADDEEGVVVATSGRC
jgi:hypothetical protein